MDNIKIKHFKKSLNECDIFYDSNECDILYDSNECDIFYDSNYYENNELSEILSKLYNYYSSFIKLHNIENELISNDKSMYIICINHEYNKYHYHLENNIKNFIKTHTYKYILKKKISNKTEKFIFRENINIALRSAIHKIVKIKCIKEIENNIILLYYYVPNSIKTLNIEHGIEYCNNLNNKLNLLLINKELITKCSKKIKLPNYCTVIFKEMNIIRKEQKSIILKKINFKLCIIDNFKYKTLFD